MRNLNVRFWLVLALQTVLILAVPAQAIYTQTQGRSLVLQTAPVDPYSILQGYSVTLGYEISNRQNLAKLPGWKEVEARIKPDRQRPLAVQSSQEFYVIFQAPNENSSRPPKAWQPVAVSSRRPQSLPANQVALRGSDRQGQISYGLETYFIPEDQRNDINEKVRQAQGERSKPAIVVEAKVGAGGNALPTAIWLKNQRYQF